MIRTIDSFEDYCFFESCPSTTCNARTLKLERDIATLPIFITHTHIAL